MSHAAILDLIRVEFPGDFFPQHAQYRLAVKTLIAETGKLFREVGDNDHQLQLRVILERGAEFIAEGRIGKILVFDIDIVPRLANSLFVGIECAFRIRGFDDLRVYVW